MSAASVARRSRVAAVVVLTLLGLVVPLAVAGVSSAGAAGPGAVTLQVQSARTVGGGSPIVKGAPIAAYQWLIASEDVGNPHDTAANCLPARAGGTDAFSTTCGWPSVRSTPGAVPVVAQGDQAALNGTVALPDLPAGRYLISVVSDGYKIDGAHFTVNGGTQRVTVDMQPYPLPLGTARIRVFNDRVPVDATYEVGAEPGLAGFTAHLSDVLGEVTTDYYGNPLCTTYVHTGPNGTGPITFDADGKPVVAADSTGKCVSDAAGDITIPNLGPDRYASSVVPPTGQTWAQTTTLEGAHDWDIWVQEGDTGFDTEQTVGGERVPYVDFGFVAPTTLPAGGTAHVKGVAVQIDTYVGGTGGVNVPNAGVAGANVRGPVPSPWVALSALGNNDQGAYVGRGNANGSFDIAGVPNGDYQLTLWDDEQSLILDSFNVTVNNNTTVDIGQKGLVGWHARYEGSVFVDTNGNGVRDPGEAGVPQFPIILKERDNSQMDQGVAGVSTDRNGNYVLPQSYPLSKFLVMEAFNTRYKSTGITYQADNQAQPTTLLGSAVDVSVLPIIGLRGRVDWGVQPYVGTDNGGIVGTVSYDTTRNELDPADAVSEPYQPGVPGIGVHLYAVARGPDGAPLLNADGSVQHGPELADTITSETWEKPTGCVPRDHSGAPLTDQLAVGLPGETPSCVEAPLQGIQVQPSDANPANFGQTVNGNYGFTTSKLNLYPADDTAHNPDGLALYAPLPDGQDQTLKPDDYVVSVDIPDNPLGGGKMYQVTKEEDVNVFDGDGYLPQENFPPSAAQAADPPGPPAATPTPPDAPPSQQAGIVAGCAGANHLVTVTDQAFLDAGGSPFEGQQRPLCDQKLVTVRGSQATAPNFTLFTPVPLPTHFWGLTINDLGLSNDKRSVEFGEAAGLAGVPMGIYDWAGKLVDTVDTDPNGFYEALEPSTSTYNCPLPAGPCPNMYRFVGNDPGQPGHLNAGYNRRFRTIATNFQAWPGLYTVTDTAPTQVAAVAVAPGSTQVDAVDCNPPVDRPQVFAITRPYVRATDTGAARTLTLTGEGFGATKGTGRLVATRAGAPPVTLATSGWTDRSITFSVPTSTVAAAYTISVVKSDGQPTANGITVQVLGTGYNPDLIQVNQPASAGGTVYHSVQEALNAARTAPGNGQKLVVVWPGTPTTDNPQGAYFENLIMYTRVKLQGFGPGGFYPDGSYVRGTVLDGLGFNPDNARGTAWFALLGGLAYSGPANVPDSAVVTVLSPPVGADGQPSIDGFTITGGAQADNATNLNAIYGNTRTPLGAPGAAITQGGGVYVHAGVNNLAVSNNVIIGNSGSYGGGIRVGTPYAPTIVNRNLAVSHNQIRDNGGTNLAGGIGLFEGTNNYSVDHNDLCGNFSAEYGGGISHYGRSNNGVISANRLWLNESYDEGGGIMVAGELPADLTQPSTGSGPLTIDANLIQDNVANDDGGGLRLLQAGNVPITVSNNMIDDNVSTHEGGGIALDDSTNVRIINNTVMKNLTTATAITSNGQPAPAGLSTALNSAPLQRTLPRTSPAWSNPLLFNNIFSGNLAGTWNGTTVTGIDPANAPNDWEMGSGDAGVTLTPTNSIIANPTGFTASPTNKIGVNPLVRAPFDVGVQILTSRTFPSFREAVIVAKSVAPQLQGDYHLLNATSPASRSGAVSKLYSNPPPVTVPAPLTDFDSDPRPRPVLTGPDIGADEVP